MKGGALDIDEDFQHEKLKWKIERIAWIIILILIVAALGGFLGSGLFSSRTAENNSFILKYQLIERYESPATIEITTKFSPNKDFSLWINDDFIKEVDQLIIHPRPKSNYIENSNSVFVFEETEKNSNALSIKFQFNHNKSGIKTLRTGINKEFLEIKQIILP